MNHTPQLMTKEIAQRFVDLGRQESKGKNAEVVVKYFTPDSSWTWLVTELFVDGEDGYRPAGEYSADEICLICRERPEEIALYGFCIGLEAEWGYTNLGELVEARGPLGLPIERDLYPGSDRTVAAMSHGLAA